MSPPAPHGSSEAHGARPVAEVIAPGPRHFVGDGFDVRTVFRPQRDPRATSPFVLARCTPEAHGRVILSGPRGGRFLLLAGAPIDDPVVAYGPFVMYTPEALAQAFADVRAGRMGRLSPEEG